MCVDSNTRLPVYNMQKIAEDQSFGFLRAIEYAGGMGRVRFPLSYSTMEPLLRGPLLSLNGTSAELLVGDGIEWDTAVVVALRSSDVGVGGEERD